MQKYAYARKSINPSFLCRMAFAKLSWVLSTNVYEVNLRQYTNEGNFLAFRQHMPRLKDMGVETLWFMPITPISKEKRKGDLGSYYACSDYQAVNPEFGTMEDFRELVRYAHELGMKVIIDWVANHTGADHVWTTVHPDFYLRNEEGDFFDKHGWDDVIDLNYENAALREEMKRAMEFWVRECNIDGFRCDMAMLVPVDFWHEARLQLDQLKPLFWLAECDQYNDPHYLEVFDAAYTWKWMHITEDHYRSGVPMEELKRVLYQYQDLPPHNAIRAWFTSNHDENSWNGTEYEKYGDLAQTLAVFNCTWNGIPLLYSGQELPNLKRLKFFDKDEIEWSNEPALHYFFKQLLTLHNEHPALRAATDEVSTILVSTEHSDKVLCYRRKYGVHEVLVMLNFSGWPLSTKIYEMLSLEDYSAVFPVSLSSRTYPCTIELPSRGFAVWVK